MKDGQEMDVCKWRVKKRIRSQRAVNQSINESIGASVVKELKKVGINQEE